jgi:hypothetical protein
MNINNVEIFNKKPFVVGSCDSFLNENQAFNLRAQLLKYFSNHSGKFNLSVNNKFKVDNISDKEIYRAAIKSFSSENQEFMRSLESDSFRNSILKYFSTYLIFNRLDRFSIDILLNKVFNVHNFKTSIELSFMPLGSKIVPHTDSIGKIISGLIYLPSPSENDQHLGINFYDYQKRNFQNAHYESVEEQDIFYKNAKLFCKPEFNNRFYFFFRNAKSWHDVDVIDGLSSDYVRVSINYNILIDESIFGTLRKLLLNR